MEEKSFSLLRSIGLSRNETIAYIDLITYNKSSAREVSNRTKLHRANTYEALRGLVENGFASVILLGDKRLFQAEHPKKLKEYIKQKEQEIDDLIPYLSTLAKEDPGDENVTISKGLFSARNAISSLLDTKNPIDMYGITAKSLEIFGEGYIADFHRTRIRNRIPARLLFNHNVSERLAKLNKLQYTDARYSQLQFDTATIVAICDDKILMIVALDNISTIEIKNIEIANTYREYFKVLWEHGKKYSSLE
jgi:sugar-specific transcriptional regulator TrmB